MNHDNELNHSLVNDDNRTTKNSNSTGSFMTFFIFNGVLFFLLVCTRAKAAEPHTAIKKTATRTATFESQTATSDRVFWAYLHRVTY